ncbi:hypothetical protein M2323_002405 [Rhodoblastus acidophilus]|uniref:fatty acid cis/trans isomerase n=1 Tax=Rhodoblastus acidophilus TaxID=1074 RepID=UPI0022250F49|nr:fatty acid cis/trans isomerase [Rhodoblastus acidophilus]MCW2284518.1 hypothetical protein [Rhodoblastus acidophilus]MCW2333471.1 hypothetical protein [Rhodoblastus acidophilus]
MAAFVVGLVVLSGADGTGALAQTPAAAPNYLNDIQPIFNRRCIACHGCLGSPCNVKLDSFRGVDRGGFGVNPYSSRLDASPRVGMDVVETTAQWRQRGFYPVLDREGTAADRLNRSLLHKMVTAGARHNQPGFSREAVMSLYAKRYDHACPADPKSLDAFLDANPAAGMPFGLPALDAADLQKLEAWVAEGSPGPTPEELRQAGAVAQEAAVAPWEDFLNDPDPRNRLVARYIFDHVYQASIVLEESPGDFFRLVRSETPPARAASGGAGDPGIKVIDTPLPYDDPYAYAKADRFWYRLQKVTAPRMQKNHFVWRLNQKSLAHLKELFLGRAWDASQDMDPPWGVGNPFLIYRAIPAEARALFLLENSEVIVGGITYGPVCLGQIATYAVKDQFWVYFLDPRYDPSVQDPKLGLETWATMMDRSPFGNAEYAVAYAQAQKKLTPEGLSIDAVWNGGRSNPNAWLTVLRHETNVSVMKGRQGGVPPSQWLISYSGFERLYYDTVASYKYWQGDLGKIETVVFFNFLRQEMEDNFLLLLPRQDREPIRQRLSQGVIGALGRSVVPFADRNLPGGVATGDRPLLELVERLQAHMGPEVSGPVDRLNPWIKPKIALDAPIRSFAQWDEAVSLLTQTTAYKFPRFLPSVVLLRLNNGSESRVYSLIANRIYKTQFDLFFQNGEALPGEDTMSVYPTLVGGFPNLFMELDLADAPAFLKELRAVQSLEDWTALRNRYGVLRNSARFWPALDWFNAWNFRRRGEEAGFLDLSYYDLLDSVY